MSEAKKLDDGEKNLLRLIMKGAGADGWAPVSKAVMPLVERMPPPLVEFERVGEEGRGRVRLTTQGNEIINAMEWL